MYGANFHTQNPLINGLGLGPHGAGPCEAMAGVPGYDSHIPSPPKKKNSIKIQREPTVWENIFANDTSDKSLISKIYN